MVTPDGCVHWSLQVGVFIGNSRWVCSLVTTGGSVHGHYRWVSSLVTPGECVHLWSQTVACSMQLVCKFLRVLAFSISF